MNERIEKLLAELDIELYTDEGVRVTSILVRPKDLRQFAELIVRECANRAYHTAFDDLTRSETESQIPGHIYRKLLEHFGVEE